MKKVILFSSLLLIAGCSSTGIESGKKMAGKKPSSSLTYSISTGPMKPKRSLSTVSNLHQVYQRWRGVPYRFGGVGEDGIDCSAFTRTMYQEVFGMELPRSTYEQVHLGREIGRDELQPGDLVFFRIGNGTQHNGVYVGDGKFAHASSSVGVTISRLDNVYWRSRYWQARRLLDDI
jgi:cell wall-associated NlpC family hydrolase